MAAGDAIVSSERNLLISRISTCNPSIESNSKPKENKQKGKPSKYPNNNKKKDKVILERMNNTGVRHCMSMEEQACAAQQK